MPGMRTPASSTGRPVTSILNPSRAELVDLVRLRRALPEAHRVLVDAGDGGGRVQAEVLADVLARAEARPPQDARRLHGARGEHDAQARGHAEPASRPRGGRPRRRRASPGLRPSRPRGRAAGAPRARRRAAGKSPPCSAFDGWGRPRGIDRSPGSRRRCGGWRVRATRAERRPPFMSDPLPPSRRSGAGATDRSRSMRSMRSSSAA